MTHTDRQTHMDKSNLIISSNSLRSIGRDNEIVSQKVTTWKLGFSNFLLNQSATT